MSTTFLRVQQVAVSMAFSLCSDGTGVVNCEKWSTYLLVNWAQGGYMYMLGSCGEFPSSVGFIGNMYFQETTYAHLSQLI